MIWHYLKIGWRNILRYKVSAGIGIIGLAMGLLCFVFCNYCARLISDVDQGFPKHERIVEVLLKSGEDNHWAGTPVHTITVLRDGFPGSIEQFTTVSYPGEMNVSFDREGGKAVTCVINTMEIDSLFKEVFSCRLLAGSWEQIFRPKNAVVLSRSMARKIYGDKNPLGQIMRPNQFSFRSPKNNYTPEEYAAIEYVIVGVIEDLPLNTSFSFLKPVDVLLCNDEYGLFYNQKMADGGTQCSTYALLRPGISLQRLNQQVDLKKHGVYLYGEMRLPEFVPSGKEYREGYRVIGYLYKGMGLLILLVALLNFFIFLTGNFLNRIKEYNIRKSLGSGRKQLFGLLFSENMLYIISVWILVFCLLELLHSHMDFTMGNRSFIFRPGVLYGQLLEYLGWGIVICALVCRGISVYLSRKYINGILRSKSGFLSGWVRNFLLGVQLTVCCLFLIACLSLYLQSRKITDSLFPGLSASEKENILEVSLDYPQLKKQENYMIGRMSQLPEVTEILRADENLMSWNSSGALWVGETYKEYRIIAVDTNFASFLHMNLNSGSIFRYPGQAVIDPVVAQWFGGEPLNQQLGNLERSGYDITGVIESLPNVYAESSIPPIWTISEHPTYCYLKVIPGSAKEMQQKVTEIMGEILPETITPQIKTLKEVIDGANALQAHMKPMFLFFTIVCLLITILGIYSAITIDTERRQKEIAIRKINGAPVICVVKIFIRLYAWLLGIAVCISFPLMWWGINQGLTMYNTRFYYGIWFWLGILCLLILVIAVTIGWKIREIINQNPVEVLRNE